MDYNLSMSQTIKFLCAILLILTALSAPHAMSSSPRPTAAPFCACCAEAGAWDLETRKIEGQEMKEINRLTPDGAADFYATEAWPADVSGVAVPDSFEPGYFVTSIVREQKDWKFFFKTSKGEKGALILTLPATAIFFVADNEQRAKQERNTPPTLYKEVRMEGSVRGTGIFAKGINARSKFRLVLQGKGNRCLSAEDFHRWNLRVSGPQAKYTIYGFFAKPVA